MPVWTPFPLTLGFDSFIGCPFQSNAAIVHYTFFIWKWNSLMCYVQWQLVLASSYINLVRLAPTLTKMEGSWFFNCHIIIELVEKSKQMQTITWMENKFLGRCLANETTYSCFGTTQILAAFRRDKINYLLIKVSIKMFGIPNPGIWCMAFLSYIYAILHCHVVLPYTWMSLFNPDIGISI